MLTEIHLDFISRDPTYSIWKCGLQHFLVPDYFIVKRLIGSQLMNRHDNCSRCIDRQVEFTRGKILLLGSVPNEPIVKGLESMDDDYSGPTKDTPIKKMNSCSDIMCQKVALCKHVTLPSYTQVRVMMVTERFDLMHAERKNSVGTGRRFNSAMGTMKWLRISPLRFYQLSFLSLRRNYLKQLVISYTTMSSVIRLVVTGNMAAGICEFINLTEDQATHTAAKNESHQPELRRFK